MERLSKISVLKKNEFLRLGCWIHSRLFEVSVVTWMDDTEMMTFICEFFLVCVKNIGIGISARWKRFWLEQMVNNGDKMVCVLSLLEYLQLNLMDFLLLHQWINMVMKNLRFRDLNDMIMLLLKKRDSNRRDSILIIKILNEMKIRRMDRSIDYGPIFRLYSDGNTLFTTILERYLLLNDQKRIELNSKTLSPTQLQSLYYSHERLSHDEEILIMNSILTIGSFVIYSISF